ncbi:zinc ribbon domain-containing protein [Helicobacter aurati]|uniref:Zinc ribbon domain-containing protein n=1 Tax=Helicobacter aurati TaxID=137778 RepID=A0A3D8IZ35_9HELI|nr:zinc ribbon domain-containing protein [Helicobacter aurati]RDU69821.1 zinc ribbon domain-containing protein [Helicobacter aurati]
MALIACKECGNEVSDKAFKCQNCGVRLRKPKRGLFGFMVKWAFILFNLIMLLWVIFVFTFYSNGAIESTDEIGQVAHVMAGGFWITLTFAIWVIADFILGLFVFLTRPKE